MLKRIGIFILICSAAFAAQATYALEKALSDDDVVKLVKLGIGDEAVIAKIQQAEHVDFKVETDDLIRLKGKGVDGRVITAMLDRAGSRNGPAVRHEDSAGRGSPGSTVKLVHGNGETIGLTSLAGNLELHLRFCNGADLAQFSRRACKVAPAR